MLKTLPILRLACVLALASIPARGTQPASAPAADTASRPKVLLVQPVVLCDDDGSNPASTVFPKSRVDRVYTRAGLEFLYLEPKRWNHGAARRGEINLDQIVREGKARGVLPADPRIVSMVFVTAVDGKRNPLGRGMQNGNICFISLGEPPMAESAKQAFVVAHEVGHCLGLIHAVDDPQVPDDVPNLQGNGPFDERLAVDGLHPSQVATVLKSPLVTDRVKFLNREEAAAALTDESWFPFMQSASPDMLRFALGLSPDAGVPDGPAERTRFAREGHAAMAADFTPGECGMLTDAVNRLCRDLDAKWPMLTRLPWHFVKTKAGFCADMPHTRGMVTVFSETALKRMAANPKRALDIVFHEKIHVLQRLNPQRFGTLYQQYGYQPVTLAAGEAMRLNLIQNPDAPVNDWAALVDSKPVLIATAFERTPAGFSFREKYHHLLPARDGTSTIGDPITNPAPVETWRSRFPIRIGYDHPHEVFAYLCGEILDRQPADDTAGNTIMEATRKSLKQIFRLDGE